MPSAIPTPTPAFQTQQPLQIAIIGAGITGVLLALALEKRNIPYVLYERAACFGEIGAGIGFSPNAERALRLIDGDVHRAYKTVVPDTGVVEYFRWVNGFDGEGQGKGDGEEEEENEVFAELFIGVDSFQGGRRCDFLNVWSDMIPREKVKFRKEIDTLFEKEDGKVRLRFKNDDDDEEAEADIVIACDGIRSRTRQTLFSAATSPSSAAYTHKFCFRALLPVPVVVPVIGETRTKLRFMYNGPNAHIITYPVANNTLLNVLFVISDPEPWTHPRHTAPGTKSEIANAYVGWHPFIRHLIDLLPDDLDKWAIFDMYDNPVPAYNKGPVALAGDAAHASGPHLGAGAGFGIEDALVLASVLEAAAQQERPGKRRVDICHDALAAYNAVRYERGQWLPGATREAVDLFQWRDSEVSTNPEKYLSRVGRLYHEIWDENLDVMVDTTVKEFRKRLRPSNQDPGNEGGL
ncbi:hypothetical protein GGS20DRAFT_366611 [Poronia punctata]|nr:hypothetical protein GGS20DRAFT_366611 [Poronia punctata]